MDRKPVTLETMKANAATLFSGELLLAAGDYSAGEHNAMTVGWGFAGYAWGRPVVVVMVRPQRYTFNFMENYPDFTLSAFDGYYREALKIMGTKSGRDCDKYALAGLTPIAAKTVAAPAFAEARLVIECKKTLVRAVVEQDFIDAGVVNEAYAARDFHKLYFGEVTFVEEARTRIK